MEKNCTDWAVRQRMDSLGRVDRTRLSCLAPLAPSLLIEGRGCAKGRARKPAPKVLKVGSTGGWCLDARALEPTRAAGRVFSFHRRYAGYPLPPNSLSHLETARLSQLSSPPARSQLLFTGARWRHGQCQE